jgi:hypothetical protein
MTIKNDPVFGCDTEVFFDPKWGRCYRPGSLVRNVKPSQLTDEEWAVVEERSTEKFLYGNDARKWLHGEHVSANRWRTDCPYPHVPNAKTRAAMLEGQRGGLPSVEDVSSLLAALNQPVTE